MSPEVMHEESRMLHILEFLNKLYLLSEALEEHKASDEVFNFMDDSLLDEDFDACNESLSQVQVEKILPSSMVSFLIVTRRAKDKLPARAEFLEKAVEALTQERGKEKAEKLLGKYR
jgi:hypothetical protein